jgi:phosphoglycerate dehydrogenase-like enzyme
MSKPVVCVLAWMPDGMLQRLAAEFTELEFVDAREPIVFDREFGRASITHGVPPIDRLAEASSLRWIQLISAGVPQPLCPAAQARSITVTNLSGLYGPTIAEHALCLMMMLARNLHVVLCQQRECRWDRAVSKTMSDLHGRTLAIIGLGNIGQNIARLARAFGMRVIGCRRRPQPTLFVDQVYGLPELHAMLGEADFVAVAAPLIASTTGMLGSPEFKAMKRGVIYINVSRGPIARETALLEALESGHVAAAGLDVFATEPLPKEHPLWSMPQAVISPHYSGETVNQSGQPAERFARNLRSWLVGRPMEGVVDLEWGY